MTFLCRQGIVLPHAQQKLPDSLQGAVRFDALQAQGPQPLLVPWQSTLCAQLDAAIADIERQLDEPPVPHDPVAAGLHLGEVLSAGTQRWIQAYIYLADYSPSA